MKHKTKNIRKNSVFLFFLIAILLFSINGCATTGTSDTPETTISASDVSDLPSEHASTDSHTEAQNASPITITDMKGRRISLEKPAERIVALTAADCEILYAIGAGDKLVGRGKYCDYPSEVADITAVESGASTNIEEIIALEPDVVLMGDMDQTTEQITQLEAAGIQVVVSEATDIDGVYTAIEMIGTLMGKNEAAASVISKMKHTFEELEKQSTGDGSQCIYFEVSPLQYGLWTAGAHTFMDEIAGMLGMTNCFADIDGWGEISEEQIFERNPDFIVTVTMYYGDGPTPTEEILSRDGWQSITAVQNKAVLNLQNNELSRPTPRLADGAQILFDFIYKN